MTYSGERGYPRTVQYTSDANVDLGDLPNAVEAIWAEYARRNPRETRTLPEAIERVHLGACWMGEQGEYEDALGHAHDTPPAVCLDPTLARAPAQAEKHFGPGVVMDTVRHEMAHCIFGIEHDDERWVEALRLVGAAEEAQRYRERRDAWEEGRMPTACPEGHLWIDMDPQPELQPLAFFCWTCLQEYETHERRTSDIDSTVEERKREATAVRAARLELSNWWSEILPHPAARVVSLRGTGRILTFRYAKVMDGWRAVVTGWPDRARSSSAPASGIGLGRDPTDAITNLVRGMDDAGELLASLQLVREAEPEASG